MEKTTEQKLKEIETKRNELLLKLEKEKSGKMPYGIFRTYSAGVFAGYLFRRNGKEAIVKNARRLWYWDGASSLSELAMKGVAKPENCKFPIAVPEIILTEVIEFIPATMKAKASIEAVQEWKKND